MLLMMMLLYSVCDRLSNVGNVDCGVSSNAVHYYLYF